LINNKKVLAVIPARGGSKGLPEKNKKPLLGEPLVVWPIKAALGCSHIDRIILSTDCNDIAQIGISAGAEMLTLRPDYLANDNAKSADVILHVLTELEKLGESYDYVVMLEPTSPLTESSDISSALSMLESNRNYADSIVGVSVIEATHPEYSVKKLNKDIIEPAFSDDFSSLRRRQEIETLFFLEGTLYASAVSALKDKKNFYHSRTMGYEVPRWKSLEVDEIMDFICIEAILSNLSDVRK
jgi:CMP-N,N'-diacetyllegionaminic acid synthase